MNILTIESVLTSEGHAPDVSTLGDRVDAMHDVLTSDPTVLSADIVTVGGSEIHFLISITSVDDEDQGDTEARVDQLLGEAFSAAGMEISSTVEHEGASNQAVVKEFALV